MLRHALLIVVLSSIAVAPARAETYGEKVKAVDVDANTLTFAVDGKDKTLKVDGSVEVKVQRRVGKRLSVSVLKEGLKGVKVGNEVTATTEKKDGEEVVTKIVVLVEEKK